MGTRLHARADEETADRVALYLLGRMDADEACAFEVHLEACPTCREEVASLRPFVDDLVFAGPELEPPPGLRERVLAEARGRAYTLHSEQERSWLPAGVPGVEICQLRLDEGAERTTVLVRMRAGSALPYHEHGGTEECYVLRGDLRDGGLLLRTGDYVRFERGTRHSVFSRDGCLLLVNSSLHDRTVEFD